MTLNYWAILVCAVLAMVVGSIWYGPLFGKTWMRLSGLTTMDPERQAKMKKKMWQLYALQFVLALLQVWVLATYSYTLPTIISAMNALWLWIGFVMPTLAGSCIWTNDSRKTAWQRFFVQAGYQFICLIMFGAILGYWA